MLYLTISHCPVHDRKNRKPVDSKGALCALWHELRIKKSKGHYWMCPLCSIQSNFLMVWHSKNPKLPPLVAIHLWKNKRTWNLPKNFRVRIFYSVDKRWVLTLSKDRPNHSKGGQFDWSVLQNLSHFGLSPGSRRRLPEYSTGRFGVPPPFLLQTPAHSAHLVLKERHEQPSFKIKLLINAY